MKNPEQAPEANETPKKRLAILVVEDRPENIESAKVLLAGHDLTIVEGFDQALEYFDSYGNHKDEKFDAVLTDVMLPKGGDRCMSYEGQKLVRSQGPMPYGPIIALHAIQHGVAKVGIITAGSHHDDPFIFAFDNLRGFAAGDVKVVCTNRLEAYIDLQAKEQIEHPDWNDREAYQKFDERVKAGEVVRAKDWAALLDKLLS